MLLGAGGAFAGLIYVVGWFSWRGYLSYFDLPQGAVDVGTRETLSAGAYSLLPIAAASLAVLASASRRWAWVEPQRPGVLSKPVSLFWNVVLSLVCVLLFIGILSYDTYADSGWTAALAGVPGLVAYSTFFAITFLFAYQVSQRRLHWLVVTAAILALLVIPISAWSDGSLPLGGGMPTIKPRVFVPSFCTARINFPPSG